MARIRLAEAKDIPEMHRIRTSVRENQLADPLRVKLIDYEAFLDGAGRGWVAEVNDSIVGFAIADMLRANVWALFVAPDIEGRGIGRQLHDEMMEWFFTGGLEVVWLSTDPGTRAETFYRSAGWRFVRQDVDGEVRYEMARKDWPGRNDSIRHGC